MQKLLHQIFKSKQNSFQFWIASIGFCIGLFLCLAAVQIYWQVYELIAQSNQNTQYWIISKKITLNNVLMLSRAEFDEEEIAELKKQSAIQEIGYFTANQFEVVAYTKGDFPFMTELFFESVPTRFLDEIPSNWDWKKGDEFVPVILSQDFLNLYNFGFALSKGLPQLNKATIGLVTVKIRLKGSKGEQIFDGKIVGFSQRIPSVLVPESFMQWANEHIGEGKRQKPARLILQVNNPNDTELLDFIEKKGYQINREKSTMSRIALVVQVVSSIVALIGLCFIIFAVLMFIMNFHILLAEAREEIQLLIDLGYTIGMLARFLITRFFFRLILTGSISFAGVIISNYFIEQFLKENNLATSEGINGITIFVFFSLISLILLLNTFSVYRLLLKKSSLGGRV
ncbi:MAG: hypothetical protein NZ551_06400 [Microscillaceae bacterium]|nr:hypothetical protein [Microscillaceae bacterium]MDW8460824.1 hypothetical protein [Cytophagales bacterium]